MSTTNGITTGQSSQQPASSAGANAPGTSTAVPSTASTATTSNNPAESAVPRDVRLLNLIFATQGIQSYQDHVPLQLMDFAHRYTSSILQDAVLYNDHSHANLSNAGNSGSNAQLTNEDIRLAISARTNYQFKPVPPKKLLLKLASERNEKPLPPVFPTWGIRLPPEKYCLTARDWDLEEEKEEK